MNALCTLIIWGGMHYATPAWMEKLSLSPEEAQYLETRKFSAEEIARIFGVPASMIGAKDGIKSSVEQEYQDFYARTLASYAINIEQELARKLLTENDKLTYYFKFNFNSLLRASANERADYYNKGIRGGWLSRNEARMFEDANGFIDIYDQPLDDEEFETKKSNKKTNDFSDVGIEDKYVLRSKFLKFEGEQ